MEDARMPHAYEDVLVVRDGDARGNRMVVRLTTSAGRPIFAIGVPQPDIEDRLGPTWAYLFECEGVNLVDAGAHGTLDELNDGIETAGYSPRDVDRVIITHGHSDHDGAAFRFVRDAGAELWAHEVYARTLPFDDSRIQRSLKTPLAAQMDALKSRNGRSRDSGSFWHTEPGYAEAKKAAEVDRRVRGGERVGDMRLMHTPGHSPDELCVALDNVVFTGDHVLPEITPHPTCRVRFTKEVERALSPEYTDADALYGLETYIRSLRMVEELGASTQVLPAHRLFNKGRFNFSDVGRIGEIIEHHAERLEMALDVVDGEGGTLTDVTRALFPRQTPSSPVYDLALTEAMAHVELLHESGDLDVAEDGALRSAGSRNYLGVVGSSAKARLAT
jgi:glyoxylase-like metal-dependent hydrolase (beta-lactamase superfamily II)